MDVDEISRKCPPWDREELILGVILLSVWILEFISLLANIL